MPKEPDKRPAAYGGPGWRPRETSLREETGIHWGQFGADSEWKPLKAVLLHTPGPEIEDPGNPDERQFLSRVNYPRALEQHENLAETYRSYQIRVEYLNPGLNPSPNLIFQADLFFMTPEGAILARPASQVRAGEERLVARRLAALDIPILTSVHGSGTFEGADAAWLDDKTILLGVGVRTNPEGASQVTAVLDSLGVTVIQIHLPRGNMHLMGCLRLVDRQLAIAWLGRFPSSGEAALDSLGIQVAMIPDEQEARAGHALNFVTLAPRKILIPAGNPTSQDFYQELGLETIVLPVHELSKAAGAIGCITGVLERAM